MEIVIFQMGKVASTALATALRREGLDPVQGHIGSPERLAAKLKIMASSRVSEPVANIMYQDFQQELRTMFLLSRRKASPEAFSNPIKVISPVRDPLSWYWSHFAQMYQHYEDQLLRYFLARGGRQGDFQLHATLMNVLEQVFSVLDDSAEPLDDPNSLMELQRVARERDTSGTVASQINRFLLPLRWFAEDFEPAVGVDIYDHPFSISEGFGHIESSGFSIILYRYEQLTEVRQQLAQFLDRPRLSLGRSNSTEEKNIPSNVIRVLKDGRDLIPKTLVERIYETRYSQHFGYQAE